MAHRPKGKDQSKPHVITSRKIFKDVRFPIRLDRIKKHFASKNHSHEFQELVVVVSGKGRHCTEEGRYPIGTGDVFYLAPGRIHCYADTNDLYLINILFDVKVLGIPLMDLKRLAGYHALFTVEPQLRKQHRFKSRLRLSSDQLGKLLEYIERLEKEIESAVGGHRFVAVACLMQLLAYLSRSYAHIPEPDIQSVMQISEALSYLEREYRSPITLKKLARRVHMSETSLRRTFGEVMGKSPIDFLIQLRINKAKKLLRGSRQRITDISQEVGFEDSNYFSRQFHKVTGITPSGFRKLSAPL